MSHERVVVWADDGGAFAAYLRSKQPPGRQARVQPCLDGYVCFQGFWVADSGDVRAGGIERVLVSSVSRFGMVCFASRCCSAPPWN